MHKAYIAEYVQVMQLICCGLDVLQGENATGLGYLLPTLTVILDKLNQLINREDESIGVTAEAIKNGMNNRLGDIMKMPDAQMAAIVHPKFKLYIGLRMTL